jgi:hypothetical protein
MLQTHWATVLHGQIQLSDQANLAEGTKLLVTVLSEDADSFWTDASEQSLAAVWDNTEDDAYAQLLEE